MSAAGVGREGSGRLHRGWGCAPLLRGMLSCALFSSTPGFPRQQHKAPPHHRVLTVEAVSRKQTLYRL